MPTLLARNASVLVIEQLGPTQQLPQRADLVLDLSGQIVLPGFVNTVDAHNCFARQFAGQS
jgi:cytosine/adenosine deaminase-related metal-dependent hydrolase